MHKTITLLLPVKLVVPQNSHTTIDIMHRGGSRAAATSKMECFVIIVNGFQSSNIITKALHLGCCSSLDLPLMHTKHFVEVSASVTKPVFFYFITDTHLSRQYLHCPLNSKVLVLFKTARTSSFSGNQSIRAPEPAMLLKPTCICRVNSTRLSFYFLSSQLSGQLLNLSLKINV